MRAVFEAPTVAGLGRQIEAGAGDSSTLHGPSSAQVHGRAAAGLYASDLKLEKFIDGATLLGAPGLSGPSGEVSTVLLTGATGFLGRYLVLEWLERLAPVGGTLICLVRGDSDRAARRRLERIFDTGDATLLAQFRALAGAGRLRVIAGDKGRLNLGLDESRWAELAESVDLIVDSAALVNGALPYSEHFGPNVVGTAELIRLAITTNLKAFTYVSTASVGDEIEEGHSPKTPTSGSSQRPAPTGWLLQRLRQRQVEPRCCCGRRTICAGCRWRCSRSGMIMADPRFTGSSTCPTW